jgi:ATP-dependent DNA helicase DinG
VSHKPLSISSALAAMRDAGLEERPAQAQMMQAVADAFAQRKFAVLEGGTGIGKTFAYLIPSVIARKPKQRVIIATATVTLQQQLALQDLPQLERLLSRKLQYSIAKGRRRYVCAQRLYYVVGAEQSELTLFGVDEQPLPQNDTDQIERLIERLETDWDGDRDTLSQGVADTLWQRITTDAAGCSNRQCAFFKDCAYFKARRQLQKAEIIITNHDLLLSDVALGTGVLLPPLEMSLLVIDEAHHFAQKAIQHFTATVSPGFASDWLRRFVKVLKAYSDQVVLPARLIERVQDHIDHIQASLPECQRVLQSLVSDAELTRLVKLPQVLIEQAKQLAIYSQKLFADVSAIRQDIIEKHTSASLDHFEQIQVSLSLYLSRIERFHRAWQLFTLEDSPALPPTARWLTVLAQQQVQVHAAMTSAANFLPNYLWDQCVQGVVMCSATLRSLGCFDTFIQSSGLQFYQSRVMTKAFDSPFDYQRSVLQCVDLGMTPDYQNQNAFARHIADVLPTLLGDEKRGVLVLFTNRKLMHQVYEYCQAHFGDALLLPDELPKAKLLQCHRRRIDQGKPSVLFGLQSFAEGIDLPGDYCRHVVITKIPFSVPNTPIEQTLADWWRDQGKDAFSQHSLPQASLKLTQYVGRLIRQGDDVGTITLLDSRITTRSYGKLLLDSLPGFTRKTLGYNDLIDKQVKVS